MPARQLSAEQQAVIVQAYNAGQTIMEAAQRADCSSTGAYNALVRSDCHRRVRGRKLACDEAYFHKIDTEDKAYWLGFITADGHVSDRGLRVHLHARDAGHLSQLKLALSAEHKLSFSGNSVSLDIRSQQLVTDLRALGLTRRKSLTVKAAVLPPNYHADYFRGLIDGDGCLGYYGCFRISLTGTKAVLEAFAAFVYNAVGVRAKLRQCKRSWTAVITGTRGARLASRLYMGATTSLARKRRIAEQGACYYAD